MGSKAPPLQAFGFANVVSSYQRALTRDIADRVTSDLGLANQSTDRCAPTINMVQISQIQDESLHTILEEDLSSESQGSTSTHTETAPPCLRFPLGFGGELFMVSVDSRTCNNETDQE